MKQIILTLAVLLGTFSAQATTLLIENYCSQARARILFMMIAKPGGGQCNFQVPGTNPGYFMIDPMDSFTITDGVMNNFQFPFLNVYPFSGNVLCFSSFPLMPVDSLNSPDRYRFMSMRFELDNTSIMSFLADPITETGSLSGTFSLPGNPPYTVDYARLGSIYWFSFND